VFRFEANRRTVPYSSVFPFCPRFRLERELGRKCFLRLSVFVQQLSATENGTKIANRSPVELSPYSCRTRKSFLVRLKCSKCAASLGIPGRLTRHSLIVNKPPAAARDRFTTMTAFRNVRFGFRVERTIGRIGRSAQCGRCV